MAQKIYTKKFGEIEVEKSWSNNNGHIALQTNGAYCHITGLPIYDKSELKAVLTGKDLEEALHWFDHRHDTEETPPRRIMFDGDNNPIFEDGTPVESISELTQSLKPGPILEAAIRALVLKQEAQKLAEKGDKGKTGKKAKKPAGKKQKAKKPTAPKPEATKSQKPPVSPEAPAAAPV